MHITVFAQKVKDIYKKITGVEKPLFSREKIMSDKYNPTSGKDEKNLHNNVQAQSK